MRLYIKAELCLRVNPGGVITIFNSVNKFPICILGNHYPYPMPELLSKLQYKNFEKGEYTEEKPRNLEETLRIIKQFPWSEHRGVEISLTGPSVTIGDDNGNYLKAALYFNGKYCVYYLDASHHLYEYHTENLDDVCEQVSNFFDGQIALTKYEKQLFSIGSGSHFETKSFDYRLNKSFMGLYIALLSAFFLIYSAIILVFFFMKGFPSIFAFLFLLFDGICVYSIYFMIKIYIRAKDLTLNLSRGNDEFALWQGDEVMKYNKKDISQVNIYGQTGRSSKIFNLYEIVFNDNSNIFIPGALIDPFDFAAKFPEFKADYKGGYFLTSKTFRDYIR